MDQTPRSPPPAYSQEYSKPPPYFQPPNGAGGPSNVATAPGQPQQYPPPSGWYAQPQPEQTRVQIQTENTQQSGTRPTVIAVTTAPAYVAGQQQVLILGNCPSCRIGFLRNEFDICGILIAILFFPIGILCCLCMMEKRCSHCGARF